MTSSTGHLENIRKSKLSPIYQVFIGILDSYQSYSYTTLIIIIMINIVTLLEINQYAHLTTVIYVFTTSYNLVLYMLLVLLVIIEYSGMRFKLKGSIILTCAFLLLYYPLLVVGNFTTIIDV